VPFGLYVPRFGQWPRNLGSTARCCSITATWQHDNGPDFARRLAIFEISPACCAQITCFRVHIRADLGRRGGLAPLILGAREEVYPRYLNDYRLAAGTGSLVWSY